MTRAPITNNAEWQDERPIALANVRRPEVESVFLYRPESEWTYSHHASITFFDGRFYYVGNPVGSGRTPLVLSLSGDGVRFDRHFILGDNCYSQCRPGRWKGGEYGYPHTLLHEGFLYTIVSRQKEAVEVLRVRLDELSSPAEAE